MMTKQWKREKDFQLESEKEAGWVGTVMSFEARHEIINRLADVFKIYRNAESIKLEEQSRLRKFLQYEIC